MLSVQCDDRGTRPRLSPLKSGDSLRAEPEALDVPAEAFAPEAEAHLHRADVARLHDDVRERDRAVPVTLSLIDDARPDR